MEELVHKGANWYGEFPIKIGEIHLDPKGLRKSPTVFADYTDLVIKGIIPDKNYSISNKKSENDLYVTTNKIKVRLHSNEGDYYEEVEPAINELQSLCTYISGGFRAYQ